MRRRGGEGGPGAPRDLFFARWLRRSLRTQLAAGAIATASLALTAAVVFCLVTLTAGVERQLGKELSVYGANLVVRPRSVPLRFGLGALELGPAEEATALSEAAVERLPSLAEAGIGAMAPALLARAEVRGQAVGAVGYDLAALRRLNPLWRVAPAWPAPGEAMAGASAARRLRVAAGDEVEVKVEGRAERLRIASVVETGGPEDEDLFVPLRALQRLARREGEVSLVLVRADLSARTPEAAARAIEAAVAGAEVRTIAQVARAEASLLAKVRRLLLLVTVALGAAAAFTVSGTLGTLLLARRQEIGLCLALGAAVARVRRLLLAEAAASGAVGGLAGCALGLVAAEAISMSVFGMLVPVAPLAAPLALATALALAVGGAIWPVARALRVSPCDTLRAP